MTKYSSYIIFINSLRPRFTLAILTTTINSVHKFNVNTINT